MARRTDKARHANGRAARSQGFGRNFCRNRWRTGRTRSSRTCDRLRVSRNVSTAAGQQTAKTTAERLSLVR